MSVGLPEHVPADQEIQHLVAEVINAAQTVAQYNFAQIPQDLPTPESSIN